MSLPGCFEYHRSVRMPHKRPRPAIPEAVFRDLWSGSVAPGLGGSRSFGAVQAAPSSPGRRIPTYGLCDWSADDVLALGRDSSLVGRPDPHWSLNDRWGKCIGFIFLDFELRRNT